MMKSNTDPLLPENREEDRTKRKSQKDKKKYITMIFSVIIAVGLWIFVIGNENPTIKMTYSNIPIEYLNEDSLEEDGLVVAASQAPAVVKVTLQGKRADLLDLDSDDVAATVDVSEYTKGDHYASMEVHAPNNVKVVSTRPSQIKITVESLVSSEKPVSVLFNGESPVNKEPVFLGVEPEHITITGASSAVKSVKNLQAVIDVSDVTSRKKSMNVQLKPVDKLGNEVKGISLSAEKADVTVQMYSTKSVPLNVQTTGTADAEYSVSVDAPESVQISCPDSLIDSVSEITTKPVDISGITELTEVSLIPILPDGVRLASNQEKIAAAIKVQKRPTKTIKVDVGDILLDGLAEGKNVEFEDETVTLTIYADEDLADVEASQFVLHLDCGTLKENEFTEAELTVDIDESLQDLNITAGIPAVSAKLIVE